MFDADNDTEPERWTQAPARANSFHFHQDLGPLAHAGVKNHARPRRSSTGAAAMRVAFELKPTATPPARGH